MSEYPIEASSTVRKRWMGKELIMVPTIESVAGASLRSKRVLDVGCGDGCLPRDYLKWGAKHVVAVDCNEEAIKACQLENYGNPQLEFNNIDPLEMNFKAEFDVAMAIFVLQFAEDVNELRKILKNIAKALKSGGVIYGYVPNGVRNINPTIKEGKILGATMVFPNRPPPPKDGEQAKMRLYGAESMHEVPITFFYRETYERMLKLAGFVRIEWIPPRVPKEAEQEYGKDVLKSFLDPPKDIMFRAVKGGKHERFP